MKIVLLQDIKRFGQKGQVVDVSDGYASSYLIPRGMARTATEHDEQAFSKRQEHTAQVQKEQVEYARNLQKKYNHKKIHFSGNTNPQGKLFEAISKQAIASKMPGMHADYLKLKKPLKEVGEYSVDFAIHDHKGSITVVIER